MTDIYQKLKPIIDECYQVFGRYPMPKSPINICYDCCVSADIAKDLVTLPLKDLTKKHLYEYNSSAKNAEENPDELKYFLPRMIELFAQGEALYHSTELYFVRVENCPKWSFSITEQAVWQKFADAYLDEILKVFPWQHHEIFNLYDDVFNILLMFYRANIDIQPFLERWRNTNTPQAVFNYINGSYWLWCQGITNAFAHQYPNFEDIVINWLYDNDNRYYFIEQILNLDETLIEQFYAWNERYGMIEHLFDLMTYDLKPNQ